MQRSETCDFVLNEKEPQWSLVLNCNKQTTLNYGPYFDRQREALWNFFFPPTYVVLEPCPEPTLNERRQISKFDMTINLNDPNTEINILFAALTDTSPSSLPNEIDEPARERKLTLRCKSPSTVVCSFPWLTKQYGYKTSIVCDFNNVHSLTNLSFRHFLSGESIRLDLNINYPLRWNELQVWNVDLTLSKSSVFFVFFHKVFFQDLINDWSSRYMADIRTFAPYIYDIKLRANDLEFILPCGQHNWIDVCVLENNSKWIVGLFVQLVLDLVLIILFFSFF